MGAIVAIAVFTGATPTIAQEAPEPPAAELRLVLGGLQGLRQANEDRPVRVSVRAVGSDFVGVRVVLRNSDGEVVGKSGRFALGDDQRKVARIEVTEDLPLGLYRARATGRTP